MSDQAGVVVHSSRQVTVLVTLMCLSSVSLFAILPYLTLFLKEQYALSITAAGLVVSSIALVSACGAWVGGMIVDRFGWLNMLRLSSSLYILVFIALVVTRRADAVIAVILLIGACRLLMEPALKTALAIYDDGSGRMFKLRYLALVGGAVIGPVISTALMPWGPRSGFALAALLFAVHLLLTALLHADQPDAQSSRPGTLSVDWLAITTLICLGFVFFLGFSQFETTLSLRLAIAFSPDGGTVYREALLLNAVLAIPVMQLSERLLTRLTPRVQVMIGVAAMTTALWLLFAAWHETWCIYLGATLFTLGEVILFPLPDIAAARLATAENRGQLMGLVDIRYLGFFVGPALGGALLDQSEFALAIALCLLSLSIFPVYLLNEKRGAR